MNLPTDTTEELSAAHQKGEDEALSIFMDIAKFEKEEAQKEFAVSRNVTWL